jgi:hypothetical protein
LDAPFAIFLLHCEPTISADPWLFMKREPLPCSGYPLLLGYFFLVGNRFALALACAGIRTGTLTAQGKTLAVTQAAVATNIHQTLDIQLNFGA